MTKLQNVKRGRIGCTHSLCIHKPCRGAFRWLSTIYGNHLKTLCRSVPDYLCLERKCPFILGIVLTTQEPSLSWSSWWRNDILSRGSFDELSMICPGGRRNSKMPWPLVGRNPQQKEILACATAPSSVLIIDVDQSYIFNDCALGSMPFRDSLWWRGGAFAMFPSSFLALNRTCLQQGTWTFIIFGIDFFVHTRFSLGASRLAWPCYLPADPPEMGSKWRGDEEYANWFAVKWTIPVTTTFTQFLLR